VQRAAETRAFTAVLHGALDHVEALPDRADRCGPDCGLPTTVPPFRETDASQKGLPLEWIGDLLAVWESGSCAQAKVDLRARAELKVYRRGHGHDAAPAH
jgi:hypothetical protein